MLTTGAVHGGVVGVPGLTFMPLTMTSQKASTCDLSKGDWLGAASCGPDSIADGACAGPPSGQGAVHMRESHRTAPHLERHRLAFDLVSVMPKW